MPGNAPPRSRTLLFVRYGLPGLIALAGLVYGAARSFDEVGIEAAVVMIAAASSLWFLSLLMRIGINSEGDRDREVEAREYFDRHGRWPDEPTPPAGPAPPESGHAKPADPHGHRRGSAPRPRR